MDSSLCRRSLLLVIGLCGCNLALGQDTPPLPLPDYDASKMIRFDDLPQAQQRRDSLNRYIWPAGLPDTRPSISVVDTPTELAAVNASLIERVERLDITVGKLDFQAIAFRILPKRSAAPKIRFIVHHGHVPDGADHYLDAGVDATIDHLLGRGCEVVIMQMPLVGWNQDRTGKLPDGKPFEIDTRGTTGHRDLFAALEPKLHGQTFALFLEPVVQVVNLLHADADDEDQLGMIGLSGGGWTTHMAAAIDSRIRYSIPVAGAMPLYARKYSPGSWGDTEQNHEPLYREVDRDGDEIPETAAGVASWLEIFALGGIGTMEQPRKQIQVLNLYDSCCFSGEIYRTYDEFLAGKVSGIGAGDWDVFIDRTHRGHLISPETLSKVLDPLLPE